MSHPRRPLSLDDSGSETGRIARAFCDRTLPKAEWTHAAHLRVGLWHLLQFPADHALDLLRDRIQAYNIASGGANTDSSGYHETITRFYVWQIDRFVNQADLAASLDELAGQLLEQHGDRELPLRYWSRDRLMSRDARRDWVAPDLRPLES